MKSRHSKMLEALRKKYYQQASNNVSRILMTCDEQPEIAYNLMSYWYHKRLNFDGYLIEIDKDLIKAAIESILDDIQKKRLNKFIRYWYKHYRFQIATLRLAKQLSELVFLKQDEAFSHLDTIIAEGVVTEGKKRKATHQLFNYALNHIDPTKKPRVQEILDLYKIHKAASCGTGS